MPTQPGPDLNGSARGPGEPDPRESPPPGPGETPSEPTGSSGQGTTPGTADWKSRAQAAEEKASRLEQELAAATASLADARRRLEASERRVRIDQELARAGTIEAESALLLVERELERNPGIDVAAAVAEVRRRKPVLFGDVATPEKTRHRAMSPATENRDTTGDIAARARETGDRRLLMKYLRARRGE